MLVFRCLPLYPKEEKGGEKSPLAALAAKPRLGNL